MKKIILTLCSILVCLPFGVKALTGNVYLSCDKTTINLNEETTCSIKANINEEVATITNMEIGLGNGLILSSVTPDPIWEGSGENGVLMLYTDEFKKNQFNIAQFVIKAVAVTSGSNVSLKNVVLSDANYEKHNFSVTPVTIEVTNTPTPTVNLINSVKINGIVEPVVDATASLNSIYVDVAENYAISKIEYSVSDSSSGVYEAIKPIDKFIEGKYYRLTITLGAKAGYEFASNVTVNAPGNITTSQSAETYTVTINYPKLEKIAIEGTIDFTGNTKVTFPETTDKPLEERGETDFDNFTMRYQYVGLTSEKNAVIDRLYKEFKQCEENNSCTDTEKLLLVNEVLDNLPEFDTEKWTDIGTDNLVPFNAKKSESGNYILYVELKDKNGNISYAYDYVLSGNVKEYVGPSTSDNLPIIVLITIILITISTYGYKKIKLFN